MTYQEIIDAIRSKDEAVTRCFFFWDGPTRDRIESMRRVDPLKAAQVRRPVCDTCRPGLLKTLFQVYDGTGFDYERCVSDFYMYLMDGDKLSSIQDSSRLMGWIVVTAYHFFMKQKKDEDKMLENPSIDTLYNKGVDFTEEDSAATARSIVEEVLAVMPNRTYARILSEVSLEVGQYQGREKSAKMQELAESLGIPIDNLYVKVSLARKQFKKTAEQLRIF